MKINEYTIAGLKKRLKKIDVGEDIINEMLNDPRKGVKELALRHRKKINRRKKDLRKWRENQQKQLSLHEAGYRLIAGLDEAGRGPLAGPVVAAAVIFDSEVKIVGLDDSKKLTENKREELFHVIQDKATTFGIGIVDNRIIDKINIHQATFLAMKRALNSMAVKPDYTLVDGNLQIPGLEIAQEAVVDGDSLINVISAASILAKVTRDRIVIEYDAEYPEYGFANNKGYGTSEHLFALRKYGPTPLHRYSFANVEQISRKAGDAVE